MRTLLLLLALPGLAAVSQTRKAQLLDMRQDACRGDARKLLDEVRKHDARWAERVWEVAESGPGYQRKLLARWRKLLAGEREKLEAAEKLHHIRVLSIYCTLVPQTVAEDVPNGRSLSGWKQPMTYDELNELKKEYGALTGLPESELDPEPSR